MTSKRLKKLLMSRGYQRDDAEQIACQSCESSLSYADFWKRFLFVFEVNDDTSPVVYIFHSMNKINRNGDKNETTDL